MSKQAAVKFLEKMEADKEFREMFMKAKDTEERMAIQKKEDFLFTKEEFLEAFKEKHHKSISKEELEKIVAAGPGQLSEPSFLSVLNFTDA